MRLQWSSHSKDFQFNSQFLLLDKDVEVGERPQEGDLIFFPLSSNYFEIKYVEHEEPFYQLGGYV